MHLDPQDEERLSAYLDGELSSDEQARVEQLLADEPAARQLLDELRAVSSTLQGLPRTHVPGDLAADVLREIERRGVQRSATSGSRSLPSTVAAAVDSSSDQPPRDGANLAKPSAGPSVKPFVEEPVDWRGRLIRPLLYAGIAVAVFAAVSFMTERAGDGPVPVARTPDDERTANADRADAERIDKAERSSANFDTDTDSDEILGKEDGWRRARSADNDASPDSRFAAPASGGAAGASAPGASGRILSKPGPMTTQSVAASTNAGQMPNHGQMAGLAADPRAYYFSQAAANGEPVLVVQCRVTPEAVRQDLVGKLLAKNSVTVDDEAAAELDTAINTNVGYGQAVTATPDNVVVEQSAMPLDVATPADQLAAPRETEALEEVPLPAAPAEQSLAQEEAGPDADLGAEDHQSDRASRDRDNKFVAKQRGEPALGNGRMLESTEVAAAEPPASADEPTVYLIDASPEQLEGVLADLKSQTEGVISLTVSPAPEAPTQNDYMNYNRGAAPEAVIVTDEADPFADSPAAAAAESAADPFAEPSAPAPASAPAAATAPAAAPAPATLPRGAPAASQLAEQPSVNQSAAPNQMVQQGQYGRRLQRRATNADEVRLQVQALGVLEDQLQNSPARNEKLDRYGNASRARKLRPDTLSNFTPDPHAAALYGQAPARYGQAPALANQANQAAAVNAPPVTNDTSAPAAAAPENMPAPGADAAQVAAPQAAGAASSRNSAMRRYGQRAGQLLQRAVIVLEVQPTPPAPAKQE